MFNIQPTMSLQHCQNVLLQLGMVAHTRNSSPLEAESGVLPQIWGHIIYTRPSQSCVARSYLKQSEVSLSPFHTHVERNELWLMKEFVISFRKCTSQCCWFSDPSHFILHCPVYGKVQVQRSLHLAGLCCGVSWPSMTLVLLERMGLCFAEHPVLVLFCCWESNSHKRNHLIGTCLQF